ncbi:WG repeat-containing protein [Mucilaginibacter conchicola]|uniref:WG repeat-containing protein n=1 Tax=Mucilaginibacter conchicola TaxID=2303333 RepID=A0A372P0Q5_9SPHI|nr:WG repeat-containing protein [Mucilaginibacter conchicola]RFZ95489.1 WG repeat-containing protein [Mucilaginibacter conchicola]
MSYNLSAAKFIVSLLIAGSISFSLKAQMAPTITMSPEVVSFQVDQFNDFHEGLAIIKRGTASSLIDNKGNTVVPFGKYQLESTELTEGFVNGYCIFRDVKTGLAGFVNSAGKVVINPLYGSASPFDNEGYAIVSDKNNATLFFVDRNGKTTPFPKVFFYSRKAITPTAALTEANGVTKSLFKAKDPRDGLPAIYTDFTSGIAVGKEDDQFGYYTRTGKKVIANKYEFAQPFSEDLAAVAYKNQYGEVKWGFIDKSGNVVIDFKYSNQPGDFHNGYAVVYPADKTTFQYAFIDKKGAVFYTVKDKSKNDRKDFQGSLAFVAGKHDLDLLDAEGKVSELSINTGTKDKKGNPVVTKSFDYDNYIDNGNIRVTMKGKHGIINTKGDVIVPIAFESISYFDPASRLAKATYKVQSKKSSEIVEGYVNTAGVFVIVRQITKTQW